MSVSEHSGVIVNHVTLAKYRELKAAGQLVNTETYVITDLDEYIDDLSNEKYWQLRAGRVIHAGNYLFLNQSALDFTGAPVNTTLITLVGQSGVTVNMKLRQSSGRFELVATVVNGADQVLATGSSLSSMSFTQEYLSITTTGYGLFCKVAFVHDSVKSVMDGSIRIENNAF